MTMGTSIPHFPRHKYTPTVPGCVPWQDGIFPWNVPRGTTDWQAHIPTHRDFRSEVFSVDCHDVTFSAERNTAGLFSKKRGVRVADSSMDRD